MPRPHRQPRLPLPLLAVAFALLAACVAPPTSEAWQAIGFRTPEQSFRTFQTALAAGDALDLEYRCLAAELRAREGITQLGYRVMREQLMKDQPFLRHAADAKVLSIEPLGPGRVLLTARVAKFFQEVTFEVELVAERYWEIWEDDLSLDGDVLDGDPSEGPNDGALQPSKDGSFLYAAVPLRSGVRAEHVTELAVGREWKLARFGVPGAPGATP